MLCFMCVELPHETTFHGRKPCFIAFDKLLFWLSCYFLLFTATAELSMYYIKHGCSCSCSCDFEFYKSMQLAIIFEIATADWLLWPWCDLVGCVTTWEYTVVYRVILLSMICSSATEEFVQRTALLLIRLMSLSSQCPEPIWNYTSPLWRFGNSLVFVISTGLHRSHFSIYFSFKIIKCSLLF